MKSTLLLSASVYALVIGAGSVAHAAAVEVNGFSGDYVNSGSIGGNALHNSGSQTDTGLYVDGVVTGNVENAVTGKIYATSVGVYIDTPSLTGSVVNDGLVSALGSDRVVAVSHYAYGTDVNPLDMQNAEGADLKAKSVGHGTSVSVSATGVAQKAYDWGAAPVSLSVSNAGHISVTASALANAPAHWDLASATASASAIGVKQYADSVDEDANITETVNNSGDIQVKAVASAAGGYDAYFESYASADATAVGISQSIYSYGGSGDGTANATNSGLIQVTASAKAIGGANAGADSAYASADATAIGVEQNVGTGYYIGGNGSASVTNNSLIEASANALAQGGANANDDAYATASASAVGINQYIEADGSAKASVTNTDSIQVAAHATATGGASAGDSAYAKANATAYGVGQEAYATEGDASASVINQGDITVAATAKAKGGADASGEAYARANASAIGIGQYVGSEYGGASASVTNSHDIQVQATAWATGGVNASSTADAHADVLVGGVGQYVNSYGPASATVTNTEGQIAALGVAHALSYSSNDATADVTAAGVAQFVDSVTSATASVENDGGTIQATAKAYAHVSSADGGDGHANALALGVFQWVQDSPPGAALSASVVNHGQIDASAYASANGSSAAVGTGEAGNFNGYPFPGVAAGGIVQVAENGTSGTLDVTNSGDVFAQAAGYAFGNDAATADVMAAGVLQLIDVSDTASATVDNQTSAYITAKAYAGAWTDYGSANADAFAVGVWQYVTGPLGGANEANAVATNAGEIWAYADATAYASESAAVAHASADAIGIEQNAFSEATSTAVAKVTNSGEVYATADAMASGWLGDVNAKAQAVGVGQYVGGPSDGEVSATVINTGGIYAYANGYAASSLYVSRSSNGDINYVDVYGFQPGTINADAYGVAQDGYGGNPDVNFTLDNSGYIGAYAYGYGDVDTVNALAVGAMVGSTTSDSGLVAMIDYLNESNGVIDARASAYNLGGSANATAIGWAFAAGTVNGSAENLGVISAQAYGYGYESEKAHAIGVEVLANANDLTVTNEGLISAWANESSYVPAEAATGVYVAPYATGNGEAGSFKLVNDGGTIYAGIASNGGALRGNAINVADVVDPESLVTIDLKGTNQDGNIYGDIQLHSTSTASGYSQVINVSDGRTRFNGVINATDNYNGELNIEDGGTFHLALNQDPLTPEEFEFDGLTAAQQPRVYVDQLNIDNGGTLSIGLSNDNLFNSGTDVGDYGQVFANNVQLDGNVITGALKGFFIADYYGGHSTSTGVTWKYEQVLTGGNLIDTETGFAAGQVYSNTPLIDITASYTSDYVSLVAHRNSFESVANSPNEKSVGAAIDSVYAGLTNPQYNDAYAEGPDYTFSDLIASIFALDGNQAYQDKLDELSAEPYAQQLSQELDSFGPLQDFLLDRLGGAPAGGGSALGYAGEQVASNSPASNAIATTGSIPAPAKASVWARGFAGWGSQSDPSTALAYSSNQSGGYLGGDINPTANTTIGLAGGVNGSNMTFDNGDNISSSGYQVAAYGRWDGSDMYLRGFGGYGGYSNTSKRYVVINSTAQDADGSYNSRVGTAYGELGFTGWQSRMMGLVPFVGLSGAWGSNDAFTETGESSGTLDVAAATGSRVASSLGAQWDMHSKWGSLPFSATVRAAWEHTWAGSLQSVGADFSADPTAAFVSTSSNGTDFAAVSASGTLTLAAMTFLTLQYDGKYGSGLTETSLSGTLKQKF